MTRRKDSPQKATMRGLVREHLKNKIVYNKVRNLGDKKSH